MELQDFLSKLSLPQDFTRRGFLKVHLGSPWNAALTFKKKYRSSRKP